MIATPDMLVTGSPFVGYAYAYPHKTAYRRLEPAVPLAEAWQGERRDSLFLYLHVPFCEYRCGFCNLFTLANAETGLTAAYLKQLRAEADAAGSVLADARFARVAIGGGTPTFLAEHELAELLEIVDRLLASTPARPPSSCEASPATLTTHKARLLKDWGIQRISLGVQTLDDVESRRLGRPQRASDVFRAIATAREQSFNTLNLDLIYGSPGQSLASWLRTVEAAVAERPEEIYLYPLYVRELTGLGNLSVAPGDDRLEHFRAARDILAAAGYLQGSLRMFSLPQNSAGAGPVYCCQDDGMLGLGCGARSYTRALHYSSEFAVGRSGIRSILLDYLNRQPARFLTAEQGYLLDDEEQRRRFVIQSLLQTAGLTRSGYARRFGGDPLADLPQLLHLEDLALATIEPDHLQLTAAGIERSDAIGPWLYSERVRLLMEDYRCT